MAVIEPVPPIVTHGPAPQQYNDPMGHSYREIKSRWLRTINERLTEDKITATMFKRNKGFTNLIVNTWEKVLARKGDLPNDWTNRREVLVGSRVRP